MKWYTGEGIVEEVWSETALNGDTLAVFEDIHTGDIKEILFHENESPFNLLGWEPIEDYSPEERELIHLFSSFNEIFSK